MRVQIGRTAFNTLRRDTAGIDLSAPGSKFNFAKSVKDGLGSAVIVAPALWAARQFPEAPIAVRDPAGELHYDHPLAELVNCPNER